MVRKTTPFRLEVHDRNLHSAILDTLQWRLREIGIAYGNLFWTMRDGLYKPNGKIEEFPDLVIFLKDSDKARKASSAVPIELKTGKENPRDYAKAVHQLFNGARFALDVQKVDVEYGIVVTTLDGKVLNPRKVFYDEMERACR